MREEPGLSWSTTILLDGIIGEGLTKRVQALCEEWSIELSWMRVFPAVRPGEETWRKDYCVAVNCPADHPFDIERAVRMRLVPCDSLDTAYSQSRNSIQDRPRAST